MTLFMLLLTTGGCILGFFLLVDGIAYLVANTGGRGASRADRRLFVAGATVGAEQSTLEKPEDESNAVTEIGRYLEKRIAAADLKLKPHQLYLVGAGVLVASFAGMAGILKFVPLWILASVATFLGAAVPVFYVNSKAAERVRKFQQQFPDALDLVVRSLRVGHPLSAALATIANEIPDPLGREFAIAARQVTFGKSTPQAIDGIAERISLPDVRFFSVAVQIHHESGGNLAEILNGLSTVIRARFQLFRKMQALTIEGRFSAWFLSIFPVLMIFVMAAMQPGYYEKVSDFAYFPHMMAATFFLLIVNVIAMRMITKLEV